MTDLSWSTPSRPSAAPGRLSEGCHLPARRWCPPGVR